MDNDLNKLDYFLKYVQIDTQSDDTSLTSPSSDKQLNLAKEILNDITKLGFNNAYIDEFGQVHLFIEGEKGYDTIGFNAHMDTALEVSGKNVKPNIINNYSGQDIILKNNVILSKNDFPILNDFIGDTLITTDGTTLLGADDKAGISIIMNLIRYIANSKDFKHVPISILFTCDEEIGRGADHFDNKIFKANYAYTIDGDTPYGISYENFNAASVVVKISGFNIHPGEAKGKMINSILLANEFDNLLNPDETPAKTQDYQGFHHLNSINGEESLTTMNYIVRDFDKEKLEEKLNQFIKAKGIIEEKYNKSHVDLNIKYQYKNMAEIINQNKSVLDKIIKAYNNLNIPYKFIPIRGGTDGATFSFKGCPTPNLGTGSYNHHGVLEFLNVREHNMLIEILKEVVKI